MTVSPQLGQNEKVTLHYFGVKGAGAVATIAFEEGGVEYEANNWGMDFAKWGEFKPKTPTGMLPLVEYSDGTMLAESGACQRLAGAMGGLLGEGKDFVKSEMLMGMNADLWKLVDSNAPTIMTVEKWDADKTKAWNEEHLPKIKTKLESYATLLNGDKFTTKGNLLGELEFWFRLYQLKNGGYPAVLDEVAALKPFYDRLAQAKGPKKFIDGESKFGALIDYFVPLPK